MKSVSFWSLWKRWSHWEVLKTGTAETIFTPQKSLCGLPKKDPINLLERKDQVAIFRLRSNHIQLNAHLSRILKDHNQSCPLCDYREESVQHFLFECPALHDIRSHFLHPNPTRENTLYAPKPQLLNTSSFYHEAMNRRTQFQVWLDQTYIHTY